MIFHYKLKTEYYFQQELKYSINLTSGHVLLLFDTTKDEDSLCSQRDDGTTQCHHTSVSCSKKVCIVRVADASFSLNKWKHSTFMRDMTSWTHLESMTSYPKSDYVNQFHPDPIWNDGTLGFFEEVAPIKRTRRQMEYVHGGPKNCNLLLLQSTCVSCQPIWIIFSRHALQEILQLHHVPKLATPLQIS